MRAVIRERYGGLEVVRVEDRAVPDPRPGQVRLAVAAAGVDAGVWVMLTGQPWVTRLVFGPRRPRERGLGWEVAGTVEALGKDVDALKEGDRVAGVGRGTFATHCLAGAKTLARLPDTVGFEDAATLVVSGCTALQAVRDRGRVTQGQRVMVIGAGGGVGTFAVQLARHFGARVTGVCSTGKLDLVRSLGAEQVLDYTREDIANAGQHDVIVDTGGSRPFRELRGCLTPTGTFVVVGSGIGMGHLGGLDRSLTGPVLNLLTRQHIRGLLAKTTRADLETLAALTASGEVRPAITARYGIDQATEALRVLGTGHSTGKAVIVP
jgi:NADPH:quinone reductase-like Zn-dependent oxidoreductase